MDLNSSILITTDLLCPSVEIKSPTPDIHQFIWHFFFFNFQQQLSIQDRGTVCF